MITIDKGIPLPKRNTLYPFQEMDVGDSFFVIKKSRATMAGIARYWAKQLNCKFATREVSEHDIEGIRIWRIK